MSSSYPRFHRRTVMRGAAASAALLALSPVAGARFEAGAEFPLQDHEGNEQIVVLSGRIRFGSIEMSIGDFLKSRPGDVHDALALEDTLLFVAHCGGIIEAG